MSDRAPPAHPQKELEWTPPGPPPLSIEEFSTLNTDATRPGIEDQQMAICDNWVPLGKNNLRTLPDNGTPQYTVGGGLTIDFLLAGNIASSAYIFSIQSDGSILATNTLTFVTVTVATAGTVTPDGQSTGCCQWGAHYVLFVTTAASNGYFVWDGSTLYSPGDVLPFVLGPVVTIAVTGGHAGASYAANDTGIISGGSGDATYKVLTVSGGTVTSIQINAAGTAYNTANGVATTTGGSQPGSGTGLEVDITVPGGAIPTGLNGTCITSYAGRVWIANADSVTFSAPGSFSDFTTADGGGQFTANVPYLTFSYFGLISTNGFLFLVGDSSVDYISGVQTSGVPVTTTFTQQNADPQNGSPFQLSVGTLGQNVVLANYSGIYEGYGGAMNKISAMLNGIYTSRLQLPNSLGPGTPSSARAIIYGRLVWMLLLPVVDPVTQANVNKLMMTENGKKWWTGNQTLPLTAIASAEILSQPQPWGTDGTNLFPLFGSVSSTLTKTWQSKLWDKPGGLALTKYSSRVWGAVVFNNPSGPTTVTISVENEGEVANSYILTAAGTSGVQVLPPTGVAQQGVYNGATVTTNAEDMTFIKLEIATEPWEYRG